MAVLVEYCKIEVVHKLGWTGLMVMADNPTAPVAAAGAEVEEQDDSHANCNMPFPDWVAITAKCAALEAELISASAAKTFPATIAPESGAVAVIIVLVVVVEVFEATVELTICLTCRNRASSASSKGKARHWATRRQDRVRPTRGGGFGNMMETQQSITLVMDVVRAWRSFGSDLT